MGEKSSWTQPQQGKMDLGFYVSLVLVNIIFNSCYGCTLPERACVQLEVLKEQVAATAREGRGDISCVLVMSIPRLGNLVHSHPQDYNVLYMGLPLSPLRNYSWFRMWQPVQFWAVCPCCVSYTDFQFLSRCDSRRFLSGTDN